MLQTDNISALTAEIKRLVMDDRGSKLKREMQTGIDYYEGKHDIANYRLFILITRVSSLRRKPK